MKSNKLKYPLDQCALYKCSTRKRLETILTIEHGGLRHIQHAIKYRSFEIDKNNSVEKRTITAPDATLKRIQKRILFLLQRIERPEWLISGEKGKSYLDNGKSHLTSNYMLAVDIKKFYDNCRRNNVYTFFFEKMKTAADVAKILTDIVTYNNGIPTGCPTSQLIAYYAYEDMFEQISTCAQNYSCKFTLYVDDMTFSSSVPFNQEKLAREIDIILRRFGHKPNYQKVKFYSKAEPKPVTGTIVTPNHELDVPNRLQKKIYDNFQLAKELSGNNVEEETAKITRTIRGQIQASRVLDPKRFPEISRLTNEIAESLNEISNVARKPSQKQSSKIRIQTQNKH